MSSNNNNNISNNNSISNNSGNNISNNNGNNINISATRVMTEKETITRSNPCRFPLKLDRDFKVTPIPMLSHLLYTLVMDFFKIGIDLYV